MGKIGDGHLQAWMRQGLRELRGAFYPESNVAQSPELGLFGTRTPGEVAEERRGQVRNLEEEKSQDRHSVLADRVKQAEAQKNRDDRGLELER